MTHYLVVTGTGEAVGDAGNLAVAIDLMVQTEAPDASNGYLGSHQSAIHVLGPNIALQLRMPVFHVGEILIVDEDGREIGFPGRKPDKWDVTVVSYDHVEDAIHHAIQVMQQPLSPLEN